MKHSMRRLSAVLLALLATLANPNVPAQGPANSRDGFPTRPIRWIVPFPPGGPTDVVARIVGQRLGDRLGQPVFIENRSGASGNIGLEAAARAAPDGHTIVLGPTSMVLNAVLHNLNFDPLTELAPVSQLTTLNLVLLASADFPPHTVPEILRAANAKPGTVTCGWGASFPQLGCELLKIRGGAPINTIPYKGNGPAMSALIGGQIDLLFDSVNTALPQVKANRVRAIATTHATRGVGPLGHLPTVGETLPGFELPGWFGVLAPAATPRAIIMRLNREIAAVLEEEEIRKRLTDGGFEIAGGSPEAFAAVIRRDHARYSQMIREAGIKPE
jgi:tripartite-type tricarboxylate transporter receptor subunit TctC